MGAAHPAAVAVTLQVSVWHGFMHLPLWYIKSVAEPGNSLDGQQGHLYDKHTME